MKWNTAISNHQNGELHIRSQALSELMAKHTFTEVIALLLLGKLPTAQVTKMLDMILVSCAEHTVAAPSAFSARVSASAGNPISTAIAAGVLATGPWHGGAIERSGALLYSPVSPKDLVAQALAAGERLSGFGHKLYKDVDPRAEQLLVHAATCNFSGAYLTRLGQLHTELEAQSSKKLPINIDGAIAAILCELGVEPQLMNAFFVLGRIPGIIAHANEERVNEKPYRRLDQEDITYTGPTK